MNGNIQEPRESAITSQEAINQGVCIGNSEESTSWQVIDEELEGQSATTIWRTLKKWPLENARNDTACLVELKPKTGRYHQVRTTSYLNLYGIILAFLCLWYCFADHPSTYSLPFKHPYHSHQLRRHMVCWFCLNLHLSFIVHYCFWSLIFQPFSLLIAISPIFETRHG